MESNNFVLGLTELEQVGEQLTNVADDEQLAEPSVQLIEVLPTVKVNKEKPKDQPSKRALALKAAAATREYDEYVRSNPAPVLDENGNEITNDQYFNGFKRFPSNYKFPKVRVARQVKTCSRTRQKLTVLIPELSAAVNNWDTNHFKTANAHLNILLANVLEEFIKAHVGSNSTQEFVATLRIEAKAAGVNTKSSTKPIGVFVAWIFQSITRQRISVYSNGLQKLIDRGVTTAAEAAKCIEEAGGIYELSQCNKPQAHEKEVKQTVKANRIKGVCSQQIREFSSAELSAVIERTGEPYVIVVTRTSDNQFTLNGVAQNSAKALSSIEPWLSLNAQTEVEQIGEPIIKN